MFKFRIEIGVEEEEYVFKFNSPYEREEFEEFWEREATQDLVDKNVSYHRKEIDIYALVEEAYKAGFIAGCYK